MFRLFVSRPLGESEIAAWTTPEERARAEAFAPARRSEWLSWRGIVRRELGSASVRFAYSDSGAPSIAGSALHLAVSHCPGSIAAALSDAPCAVDVESLARDFSRAASRYMTPEERTLSDAPCWPALVWSAKETLYKFAGRRELDLLRDLQVGEADFSNNTLVGRICGGEALRLRFLLVAGRVIVFLS